MSAETEHHTDRRGILTTQGEKGEDGKMGFAISTVDTIFQKLIVW